MTEIPSIPDHSGAHIHVGDRVTVSPAYLERFHQTCAEGTVIDMYPNRMAALVKFDDQRTGDVGSRDLEKWPASMPTNPLPVPMKFGEEPKKRMSVELEWREGTRYRLILSEGEGLVERFGQPGWEPCPFTDPYFRDMVDIADRIAQGLGYWDVQALGSPKPERAERVVRWK